jgi:hypothetical protein
MFGVIYDIYICLFWLKFAKVSTEYRRRVRQEYLSIADDSEVQMPYLLFIIHSTYSLLNE